VIFTLLFAVGVLGGVRNIENLNLMVGGMIHRESVDWDVCFLVAWR